MKLSQGEKHKQTPYDISYMWNLKYDTNEPIYKTNRLTDIENRLVAAKGGGVGEGRIGRLGLADVNYYIEDG